jgi:hypothetical protein
MRTRCRRRRRGRMASRRRRRARAKKWILMIRRRAKNVRLTAMLRKVPSRRRRKRNPSPRRRSRKVYHLFLIYLLIIYFNPLLYRYQAGQRSSLELLVVHGLQRSCLSTTILPISSQVESMGSCVIQASLLSCTLSLKRTPLSALIRHLLHHSPISPPEIWKH